MGSTQKRRRRTRRGPTFVQLFHYMLDSPAYLSLSFKARAALIEVCRRYNGANNGRIMLSVRELAQRMNCDKETAGLALRELVEMGFLVSKMRGWFSLKTPHSTEWLLTCYRDDVTGALPSRDFETKGARPKRRKMSNIPAHGGFGNTVRNFPLNGTGNPDTKISRVKAQGTEIPDTIRPKRGTEVPDTCTSYHEGAGPIGCKDPALKRRARSKPAAITVASDCAEIVRSFRAQIEALRVDRKAAVSALELRFPELHSSLLQSITAFDRACVKQDVTEIKKHGSVLIEDWKKVARILKSEGIDVRPNAAPRFTSERMDSSSGGSEPGVVDKAGADLEDFR